MADEDELAFGGAWGDQVSFINESSSSSLNQKNEEGSPRPSTPPPPAATVSAEPTTETDDGKPSSTVTKTTPRASRIRASFRPRNLRKGQSADVEVEESSNPLDPLGGADDDDDDKYDPAGNAISPPSFHDVPLDPSSSSAYNASVSGSADDILNSGLKKLQVDAKHAIPPAIHPKDDVLPDSPDSNISFYISVGDPIKVGDITSAHTVYTVHTSTTSPAFSKSNVSVTRRYKDFRWLFHALENNNHGIIIPPPPEKQAVGRFNEDFVELRRSAMENMLTKVSKHPVLRNDPDFRLFLESEAFANDIKNRVVTPEELEQANSSGIMSTLGGAFSFSGKFIETSQWFIDKKIYIDALETQLKSLAKALDSVVSQRRDLSESTGEFGLILESLSDMEISKGLSDLLESFAHAHLKIKDLYNRQCLQDILSLSTTIDEYIRVVSSVRSVFSQRQKAFFAVQQAEQDLLKKRSHLEKLLRQGKSLQDKITVLEQDVESLEQKVVNSRVGFDDISKVIQREFDRMEHEKITDFRNSVELFLENAVESQKEAIEVWETFYQQGFPHPATTETPA